MKTTVSKSDFIDQFRVIDRLDNFSYEARSLLFDLFEEYEDASGKEMELDVIAVCCDFSEDTPEDIAANYGIDVADCEDADEVRETVLNYLNNNTIVVGETELSIVYQVF